MQGLIIWERQTKGFPRIHGVGAQSLLDLPITAFFASRQCPGLAIRSAMDWVLQQAKTGQVVASGFHSPLEHSALTVLLQARSPVVAVLARPVSSAKLPAAWAEPLAQGRMAVVSSISTPTRLTSEAATLRNAQVAQLATSIVVAHASPGGSLAGLVAQWRQEERRVTMLSDH